MATYCDKLPKELKALIQIYLDIKDVLNWCKFNKVKNNKTYWKYFYTQLFLDSSHINLILDNVPEHITYLEQYEFLYNRKKDELMGWYNIVIEEGRLDVVVYYYKRGIEINETHDYFTPILKACHESNLDIVKFLISVGANVNDNMYDFWPIIEAVKSENLELVNFLLSKGSNPNVSNDYEGTPLEIAAIMDNYSIVYSLIENGADVDGSGKYSFLSPLEHAINNNNQKIIDYLKSKEAK